MGFSKRKHSPLICHPALLPAFFPFDLLITSSLLPCCCPQFHSKGCCLHFRPGGRDLGLGVGKARLRTCKLRLQVAKPGRIVPHFPQKLQEVEFNGCLHDGAHLSLRTPPFRDRSSPDTQPRVNATSSQTNWLLMCLVMEWSSCFFGNQSQRLCCMDSGRQDKADRFARS